VDNLKNGLQEDLHRGLKERHIQLIALGGAIGVGLFLGSAAAIKVAGPSLILTYFIGGVVILYSIFVNSYSLYLPFMPKIYMIWRERSG